jgi:hypothetical protein
MLWIGLVFSLVPATVFASEVFSPAKGPLPDDLPLCKTHTCRKVEVDFDLVRKAVVDIDGVKFKSSPQLPGAGLYFVSIRAWLAS